MFKIICFILVLFLSSCTTTYYIARHAEKANATSMTSDVPLSAEGIVRADALRDSLLKKQIKHIYTTNYLRTKGTAQPLSTAIKVPVETYDPKDQSFVTKLKSLNGNVLIIGHSNTVDDLVNELIGKKLLNDLPETAYGDLFVIKKGKSDVYVQHFGKRGPNQQILMPQQGARNTRRRS